MIEFANLSLAASTFLDGSSKGAIDRAPTILQRAVQYRAVAKVYRLCVRLASADLVDDTMDVRKFVGIAEGSKYPTLNAQLVDGLEKCG